MDAYKVLNDRGLSNPITEGYFYKLIIEFRESYFKQINYYERLEKHKKPISLLNELLQGKFGNGGLYNCLLKIQGRDQMRDLDLENNSSGFVNAKIEDILENDKTIKTLYKATEVYCELRSKDFNSIAVHIAEYRAMNKVLDKINLDKAKYNTREKKKNMLKDNVNINPDTNRNNYFLYHINEMKEIRKAFEVEEVLTKEDVQKYLMADIIVHEGDIRTRIPIPETHKDSSELFKGYYGATMFSIYKNIFFQKYGSWLEPNINTEIENLQVFITRANKLKYHDAVEALKTNNDTDEYCYLRLKNDYYLHNNFKNNDMVVNSRLSSVYGKYFLFCEYLKHLLKNTSKHLNENDDLTREANHFLQNHPIPYKIYSSGIDKFEKSLYARNSLDDLRLSLELLLKDILRNDKSIEKQQNDLGSYQKQKGVSIEVANMFNVFIDYYSKYHNKNVKHNDRVMEIEVGLIVDLTTTFMKHLVRLYQK